MAYVKSPGQEMSDTTMLLKAFLARPHWCQEDNFIKVTLSHLGFLWGLRPHLKRSKSVQFNSKIENFWISQAQLYSQRFRYTGRI